MVARHVSQFPYLLVLAASCPSIDAARIETSIDDFQAATDLLPVQHHGPTMTQELSATLGHASDVLDEQVRRRTTVEHVRRHNGSSAASSLLKTWTVKTLDWYAYASGLAFGWSWDELIVVLLSWYAFCSIVVCVLSYLFEYHPERLQEKSNQRDALRAVCFKGVEEMDELLHGMSECSAHLAECNFEDHRRAFLRYVQRVGREPGRLCGHQTEIEAQEEEVTKQFRRLVGLWLRIFSQCPMDQRKRRKSLVSTRELTRCTTITEICELVHRRLEGQPVDLIGKSIESFSSCPYNQFGPQRSIREEQACWCCNWLGCELGCGIRARKPQDMDVGLPIDCLCGLLRITVLSEWHFGLLFSAISSLFLIAVEYNKGKYSFAGLACFAAFCLFLVLADMDSLDAFAQLDREVNQLEQDVHMIEARQEQVNEFYGHLQLITNLWRYRTVPQLDNFKELYEQLWDMPDQHKLNFLTELCQRLEAIDNDMGSMEMWCGDTSLPEEVLCSVAEQLMSCTTYVDRYRSQDNAAPLILERLKAIFGFLVVRVVAASDLLHRETFVLGDAWSPFVTVTLGDGRAIRTASSSGEGERCLWNDEFFMPVNYLAEVLELQVWNESQLIGNSSLGSARLQFRKLTPGQWYKTKEKLTTDGQSFSGEVEIELYFATSVEQLDWGDAPEAVMDQRLSQFLSDL